MRYILLFVIYIMNSYQDLLVNSITVISEEESTSICTGSVSIKGGVGIKGNLYVGGNIIGNSYNNNNNSSSVNFTAINSNLIPCINNTYDIGCSNKIWKDLYCNTIDVNKMMKDLIPNSNCLLNIGSCTQKWKNLFLSENADMNCLITNSIKSTNTYISICNDVCISGDLVVSGSITSNNSVVSCDNNNNNNVINELNYDLMPSCTNTFSIGNSSKKWNKLYLSEEFHIGINTDFVNINSINKLVTINGSGNNDLYGKSLEINYTGCSTTPATLLRLNHISGIYAGSKIQFDMDNIKSCTIGSNYINSKHTFTISPSDGTNFNDIIVIDNENTNINNKVNVQESLIVQKNIQYNNNIIHSYEIYLQNCTIINTMYTFTDIKIIEEYKEITFSYDNSSLQNGHIKYFIVTENNLTNCNCETSPHYKILINDLVGGSALILSSIGQSIGLIWTDMNKWVCFSGISCIII